MKEPMRGSLIRYMLGLLAASLLWPFYLAIDDPRPVFLTVGEPPPDFWTHFWDYFPSYLGNSIFTVFLAVLITTPIYFLLRFFVRLKEWSIQTHYQAAWLTGVLNCCLIFFVLNTTGLAVKGPPSFMDQFMAAGGIFALPFITTLISFILCLIIAKLWAMQNYRRS